MKTNWIPPVLGPVTSKFGNRIHPITELKSFHNGVDIAVPIGTIIVAPQAGVVHSLYENDKGGLQLIISHDNGYKTGYAHLDSTHLKIGERVVQGQEISKSGNSGASTGAHLHFTMTNILGQKIDPEQFFIFNIV